MAAFDDGNGTTLLARQTNNNMIIITECNKHDELALQILK